jgi:hypothetical protein
MSDQAQTQPKSAIQRLEDLESATQQLEAQSAQTKVFSETVLNIFKETEDAFNKMAKQVENLHRTGYATQVLTEEMKNVSGLVSFLSETVVSLISLLDSKGIVKSEEIQSNIAKNKVSKLIDNETSLSEKGFLKDIDTSERDSFLAVEQIGPEGEVQIERDHLNLQVVEDALASRFVGLKIGDSVDVGNSRSLKVLRIFKQVESATVEIPEDSQAVEQQ